MVERTEPATEIAALEKTKTKRIQIQVPEAQVDVVFSSEAAPHLHSPNFATATTSQDNLATPSIAKTLLLLNTCPRFDRIVIKASF